MPDTFVHGLADAKSRKGEDAPAAKPPLEDGAVAAYAIFDGHGGRFFSHTCAHHTAAGVDNGTQYDVLAQLIESGGADLEAHALAPGILPPYGARNP